MTLMFISLRAPECAATLFEGGNYSRAASNQRNMVCRRLEECLLLFVLAPVVGGCMLMSLACRCTWSVLYAEFLHQQTIFKTLLTIFFACNCSVAPKANPTSAVCIGRWHVETCEMAANNAKEFLPSFPPNNNPKLPSNHRVSIWDYPTLASLIWTGCGFMVWG